MHRDDGVVKAMLAEKSKEQEHSIAAAQAAIKELAEEIVSIQEEEIADIERLKLLYYATLMKQFTSNDRGFVYVNGNGIRLANLIHQEEWFEWLRGNAMSKYEYGNSNIKWKEIKIRRK